MFEKSLSLRHTISEIIDCANQSVFLVSNVYDHFDQRNTPGIAKACLSTFECFIANVSLSCLRITVSS